MNLMDRGTFGGVPRVLCAIVASKWPYFCCYFVVVAHVEGMRNDTETPRKRPTAGHSNARWAYLRDSKVLDPSHSYYIHMEGCLWDHAKIGYFLGERP